MQMMESRLRQRRRRLGVRARVTEPEKRGDDECPGGENVDFHRAAS